MVTGQMPFRGESDAAAVHGILHVDPEPVTAMRAGLPLELDRVIGKALEKDPQLRYQSAADLGADLRRLKRDSDPKATAASLRVSAPSRPNLRVPWRLVAAIAAVIALAAGGVLLWQHIHAAPLTDKDVLVLADFTNTTGDTVFDTTLREALAVQLDESPFLKILGDEQVRQDLGFMGRTASERITNQAAREICQREGDKAMIGGSIASLGTTYAITLQATNCQTGETLAREEVEAEDKEHVLRSVATAAAHIRGKLGESLASIQKLTPLEKQVTTTSLEAYRAYALGREKTASGQSLAAIPFFRSATELDPNFASAFERLAVMYCNSRETGICAGYLRKAFTLVDRVSERERLEITARYYFTVTGEYDKAVEADQLLAQTYPRDAGPRNTLGLVYRATGEWEAAAGEFQEAMRLDPKWAYPYSNQVNDYTTLDRFDEAKAVASRALAQKLDFSALHAALLRIALIDGDLAEARKHIDWLAGNPESYSGQNVQAVDAAMHGQLRKSRELHRSAAQVARERNLPSTAFRYEAEVALVDALVGNCDAARAEARNSSLPDQVPGDSFQWILPMAYCGEDGLAQKAADQVSKQYLNHVMWNTVWAPEIQAAIELNHKQPGNAIKLLQSCARYERVQTSAVYLRGLAFLSERKGLEAGAEFQKILDHKGANFSIIYPLSFVGLARAAALSGDTARARKAYQDFLAFWKDADSDVPILKEVRQEYDKLK